MHFSYQGLLAVFSRSQHATQEKLWQQQSQQTRRYTRYLHDRDDNLDLWRNESYRQSAARSRAPPATRMKCTSDIWHI